MVKIGFIHNVLNINYKLELFNRLNKICIDSNVEFSVIQLARYEGMRKSIPSSLQKIDHRFEVVDDGYVEHVSFFKKLKYVYRWIKVEDPNVIVFPGYYDLSLFFISFWAKFIKKKKVIIGVDNNIPAEESYIKWLIKKFLCNHYDGALLYGSKIEPYISNLIGQGKPILTGCAFVDIEEIEKIEGISVTKRTVIYIGRISEEKGIRHFSTILESISKLGDFKFLVVGDGEDSIKKKYLEPLLEYSSNTFEFVGAKPWAKAISYLKGCDILILPSDYEPWGLVVNEAIACDTKVIVSNKVGSSEIVNKYNFGQVVDFNVTTPDELTGILRDVVSQDLYKNKKQYYSSDVPMDIFIFLKGICR